jgi:hypothetical protein
VYTIPLSLPYGPYVFRATLSIGGVVRHRDWRFDLGPHDRVVRKKSG